MKYLTVGVLACLVSVGAHASTKHLTCTGAEAGGEGAFVSATLEDSSGEAEVQFYMAGAQCKQDNSCVTKVYKKTVLPSAIRLTYSTLGDISEDSVIDINRTDLSFTMRHTVTLFDKVVQKNITGTCTLNVDDTKKIL